MRSYKGLLVASVLATMIGTTSASAQTASRLGPSMTAISAVVRGSTVAYDYKDSIYLVVSAHGGINGVFVGADGSLGAQFPIQSTAFFSQYPGVAYSPDMNGGAGGFLVTWHQSLLSGGTVVHARFVSTTGVLGPELGFPGCVAATATCQVSINGSWWEAAADIAYSTTSKEFLVTWQGIGILGQRIALDGTLIGTNFAITPATYHRDPAVVYNPTNNEFMVVFGGADNSSAFSGFQRVAAGSGALVGPYTLLNRAGAVYITEVAYNSTTNQYLAAWYQGGTYGRLIDASGTIVSNVVLLSTSVTAYDALGIDYNATTKSFMMVSHSTTSFQDGAVELAGTNAAPDTAFLATAALPANSGNFYPKIAARAGKGEWLMSTATGFMATTVQRLQSTGFAGGPPAPPPPPPPPPPQACTPSPNVTTVSVLQYTVTFPINVTAASTCSWAASSATPWIQITSGANGTGNASVGVTVSHNPSSSPRSSSFTVGGVSITVTQGGFNRAAAHDMDGDGLSEIVWQYQTTGALASWNLRSNSVTSVQSLNVPAVSDRTWSVAGTGDLNGDGYADLIWQRTNGDVAAWLMRGISVYSSGQAMLSIPNVGTQWKIRGVGDVNGDGKADIIWQHTAGWLAVWLMDGFNVLATQLLSVPQMPDPNWTIVGAGDLNGDGRADIVWQNQVTGGLGAWYLNGATVVYQNNLSVSFLSDTNWKIKGVGDVDGDGRADLIWENIVTGGLGLWYMNGTTVIAGTSLFGSTSTPLIQTDLNWLIVGPG